MSTQPSYFYPIISRTSVAGALTACCLLGLVASSAAEDRHPQIKRYRSGEFAFDYPADFKLSVANHGAIVRLVAPNRSKYWEDAIIIRKHNKKTEECDIPQGNAPDTRDNRSIAGRRASSYSGEDAAMNRFTKTKGYVIETPNSCWRFELVRTGRPFQKLDLPKLEMKRLEKQSKQDSKTSHAAFKTILDSFVFVRPKR